MHPAPIVALPRRSSSVGGSLLVAALVFIAATATSHARLGETFDTLKGRLGKPAPQARKDTSAAVWFFEGQDGELIYTVTFNAKGVSIAEGLKPSKYAMFLQNTVRDFIDGQLAPYRDSKTTRVVKPGEKYIFGGQGYVCGEQEQVIVDDPNEILIVWAKGGLPSVIAVRPEMMQ